MEEKDCKNRNEICCTRCGANANCERGCIAHVTGRYWLNGFCNEWCQEFFPKGEFDYVLPAWADDNVRKEKQCTT